MFTHDLQHPDIFLWTKNKSIKNTEDWTLVCEYDGRDGCCHVCSTPKMEEKRRHRHQQAMGANSISHLHPQTQDLRNHTGVLSKKKIRSPNNQRSENKIDFKDQLSLLHQLTEKASTPHLTIAAIRHK